MLAGTRLANVWEETAVAAPAVPPLDGAHDWRMNNSLAFGIDITDASGNGTGFAPTAQS